jgi:hypothetical protein
VELLSCPGSFGEQISGFHNFTDTEASFSVRVERLEYNLSGRPNNAFRVSGPLCEDGRIME